MNNENNGFYGDDGEFYPEGSQSAEMYKQSHSQENLYPKRPNISYTTQAMPQDAPNIKVAPDAPAERDSYGGEVYEGKTKFCKFCGKKIAFDAVVCTHCGRQVELLQQAAPAQTVINNVNNNSNYVSPAPTYSGKNPCLKNKWVAFFLCLFFGEFGIHKFYEGKVGLGILYLCTGGLLGIGWLIDTIKLLFKPNPYSV